MVQYLGVKLVFTKKPKTASPEEPEEMSAEEREKIKIMKRRSEAELEAFQTLVNYNPSIAYGTAPLPDDKTEED